MARLRCRTSYGTRRTPTMSAGPPPAVADPGPPAVAYAGATPEPSWTDASLEDILTALALGYSARSSASPFAYVPPLASSPCRTSALRWVLLSRTDTLHNRRSLPIEIVHTHIRRAVETAYWGDRGKHGLLTPPQSPRPAAPVCPGAPARPKAVRLATRGERDGRLQCLARIKKRLCLPLLEPGPGPPSLHATDLASSEDSSDFEPQALLGGGDARDCHGALKLRQLLEL